MMSFCPIGRPIVFNSNASRPDSKAAAASTSQSLHTSMPWRSRQDVSIALGASLSPKREFGQDRRGNANPVASGDLGRGPPEHTPLAVKMHQRRPIRR